MHAFVVVRAIEGQGEGPDRSGRCRAARPSTAQESSPAAQVAADRHVGAQAQAHRFVEHVRGTVQRTPRRSRWPRRLSTVGSRSPSSGTAAMCRAGGEQVVTGRHLIDARRTACAGWPPSRRPGRRSRVPAGRHAGREQRLHLGGEVERAVVLGVEERLDAEAVAGGEQRRFGSSQRTKANSPRRSVQAGGAEVLVEVQRDLAVGARASVTRPSSSRWIALVVVELAVDDDVQALVLAGDRLVAGVRGR